MRTEYGGLNNVVPIDDLLNAVLSGRVGLIYLIALIILWSQFVLIFILSCMTGMKHRRIVCTASEEVIVLKLYVF